jgi:subtilisin-like proprotein convertase family protein
VTSVRNIGAAGIVADMQVTIGSITHAYISDLTIDLTSPDGTTVRLFDRRGGSGDDMTDTVFSDAAATPISAGTAPFTGTFQPEQPLSAFKGKSVTGNWTLTVKDRETPDVGTLHSWSLTRKLYVCN